MEMREDSVPRIGKCPGCQKSSRIMGNGACDGCQRFGPNFGRTASRIRREPEFKRMCFRALKSDEMKAAFVTMFGEVG